MIEIVFQCNLALKESLLAEYSNNREFNIPDIAGLPPTFNEWTHLA